MSRFYKLVLHCTKEKLAFDPDLSVTVTTQLSWIQKIERKERVPCRKTFGFLDFLLCLNLQLFHYLVVFLQ